MDESAIGDVVLYFRALQRQNNKNAMFRGAHRGHATNRMARMVMWEDYKSDKLHTDMLKFGMACCAPETSEELQSLA